MKTNEVLHVAAIIDEFFGQEARDHGVGHWWIVTLLEQFAAQILRCVVAPRQCIQRRHAGGARVERIYPRAGQGITPL